MQGVLARCKVGKKNNRQIGKKRNKHKRRGGIAMLKYNDKCEVWQGVLEWAKAQVTNSRQLALITNNCI